MDNTEKIIPQEPVLIPEEQEILAAEKTLEEINSELEEKPEPKADAPEEPTMEEAPSKNSEPDEELKLSPIDEIRELAEKEADEWAYLPKPMGRLKKKRNHTFIKLFIPMLVTFVVLFIITCNAVFASGWFVNRFMPQDNTMQFTLPIAETPKLEDRYYQPDGRYTVEGVAQAVRNSIVTIECYMVGQPLLPISQGSGVVMSADGYIITNAHVIEGATLSILVRTANEKEYEATVVGSDVKSDLAIIKVQADAKLFPAQFGDSDALVLGEQVVALGTPAGLEGTVTTGIVSGLDRPVRVDTVNIEMSCIQIDAAINPGNSGGALINMWGQVVGITSSKMDSVDFDNIGFAIEMSAAKPILEQLIEHGRVLGRPKIGISFYEVSDALGAQNDVPGGLYIAEIDPSCDIANTELQVDDIIIEMNGKAVRSADDVYDIILKLAPGDTVTAKALRYNQITDDYKEFEISFKLMEDGSEFVEETAPETEAVE